MKRPFGVTIIGILLLVQGLLLVASASAVILLGITPGVGHFQPPSVVDFAGLSASDGLSATLVAALGVFIMLSAVGVLRLRSWAWLAAMTLQGWTMAVFLLSDLTRGRSSYPTAIISVVIVFYLNSRAVRQTFDVVRTREAAGAASPSAGARSATVAEAESRNRGEGSP